MAHDSSFRPRHSFNSLPLPIALPNTKHSGSQFRCLNPMRQYKRPYYPRMRADGLHTRRPYTMPKRPKTPSSLSPACFVNGKCSLNLPTFFLPFSCCHNKVTWFRDRIPPGLSSSIPSDSQDVLHRDHPDYGWICERLWMMCVVSRSAWGRVGRHSQYRGVEVKREKPRSASSCRESRIGKQKRTH